jgi:hypothetical protein
MGFNYIQLHLHKNKKYTMVAVFLMGMFIWLLGVYVAYFQLQKWNLVYYITSSDTPEILVLLSLLSWVIYPVYGIAWLLNNLNGE